MARSGMEGFALGAMNLISNKADQILNSALDTITFKQWFLLVMISKMGDGPKILQDVADFSGTSRQNTKRMLTSLADAGLCVLEPSRFDARALSVTLTRKGKNLIANQAQIVDGRLSPLFETLTDKEMDVLVVALQKLLTAVEDAHE